MSGTLRGTTVQISRPNVMFSLADSLGAGMQDEQTYQRNRLLLDQAQRKDAADLSFRNAAPGAIAGDQAAMTAATQADPERAMQLAQHIATLDTAKRTKSLQSLTMISQGAASLLSLPPEQRKAAYPVVKERLRAAGIDVSGMPDEYGGDAATLAGARLSQSVNEQLKAYDERIVPMGGGGGAGGGGNGSYADRVVAAERGATPDARNPRSSATGNGQFIDQTWRDFAAANPQQFAGMNDQQILAARSDPALSRQAVDWYAAQNKPLLAAAGHEPSDANAGLAHRFGPGDAIKILDAAKQNPAVPMAAVVGPQVMAANPHLSGMTVGDAVAGAQRFGSAAAGQVAGGAPVPLGHQGTGMPATAGAQPGKQWARSNGQVVQIPIPGAGDERLNPPEGYRYNADRSALEYIKGGPKDPTVLAAQEATKRTAKPMPVALQKLDNEDIESIQTARSIQTDIGDLRAQMERGDFKTGLFARAGYGLASAIGESGPEGRAYSSFRATLEKLRNDSLRLNKGVQTEGDAQRAWNELFTNINDTETVKQRLTEIARINDRAANLKVLQLNRRREENGAAPIDEAQIFRPQSVLQGSQPAGGGAAPTGAAVPALPPGFQLVR